MQWLKISVQSPPQFSEAVADVFYECGSGGVVIEDPALIAQYISSGDWDEYEIDEAILDRNYDTIIGYFSYDNQTDDSSFSSKQYNKFKVCISFLEKQTGQSFDVTAEEVEDEKWNANWRNYYKIYKPGKSIVIKPAWIDYQPKNGEKIVALDPGMSFGSGTHATTSMCIKLLENIIQGGERIYDVGTGSGVLALTAVRLGAQHVDAFDTDNIAVLTARDNIILNNMQDRISVSKANMLDKADKQADIIIANIVSDVIIKMLPSVPELLNESGSFLASGIINSRWTDVRECILDNGLSIIDVMHDGDWIAVHTIKPAEYEA